MQTGRSDFPDAPPVIFDKYRQNIRKINKRKLNPPVEQLAFLARHRPIVDSRLIGKCHFFVSLCARLFRVNIKF